MGEKPTTADEERKGGLATPASESPMPGGMEDRVVQEPGALNPNVGSPVPNEAKALIRNSNTTAGGSAAGIAIGDPGVNGITTDDLTGGSGALPEDGGVTETDDWHPGVSKEGGAGASPDSPAEATNLNSSKSNQT
jgi:hypothetical protein